MKNKITQRRVYLVGQERMNVYSRGSELSSRGRYNSENRNATVCPQNYCSSSSQFICLWFHKEEEIM